MKEVLREKFTKGLFLNLPLIFSSLISLICLPVVLKNLPVVDYGKWQFILAIQMWIFCFTAGNIINGAQKGIVNELNGTFLFAFFSRLKISLPVLIIVFLIAIILKILNYSTFSFLLLVIALYLVGILFYSTFSSFLIAKKRFKEWCFWQIFISSFSLIGSAIVAFYTKNVVYFALFRLGSISVLSFVLWIFLVKKENLILSYKRGEIDKECFSYGLKLIPVDLILVTSTKISHFIIGPFFGFSNLAIFSVASKLREKITGVIKSLQLLLYADFAKKEREELIKIINRYLIKVGSLGTILIFGFFVAGWFYIKFFLPETFHKAIIYFAILCVGLPAGVLAIILHTILESHLRYKELTVVGIFPNLLKIILILIFGYFWKIIGICFALALSGWIHFLFYYALTVKSKSVIKFIQKYSWLKRSVERY